MDPSQLPQLRHSEGDSCPECKSGKLVENQEQGELACTKCGYVAAERLEDHKLNIKYDENDQPISSLSMPFQKSSFIGNSRKDYSGMPITGSMKQTMERLRLWDSRAGTTSRLRTIKVSSQMISKWSKELGVSNSAMNEANRMFAKALDVKIVRGRTIRGIAIASLKLSCKVNGIPRDDSQFLEVSGVRKKELGRSYRILVKSLNIDSMSMGTTTGPQDFLSVISGKLGIPESAVRAAAKILDSATQEGILDGKSRIGLAASALYIACRTEGLSFSQEAIGKAAKISSVTIRHDVTLLVDRLNIGPFQKVKIKSPSQKFPQKVEDPQYQTPKIPKAKKTDKKQDYNKTEAFNKKRDEYLKLLTENLPEAKEISARAIQLFDLSQNKNVLNSLRPSSAFAAAFAISYDEAKLEMNVYEISQKMGLNQSTVSNAIRVIRKGLELPKVSHMEHYMLKVSGELGIPKEITLFSQDLGTKLKQKNLFPNASEKMLASSLMYVSCLYNNYDITPKDLYPKYHMSRYSFDLTAKGINDELGLNLRSGRRLVKRKEAEVKEILKGVLDSQQIPQGIIARTNELVEKSKEINFMPTSDTKTIVSGALYAATLELGEEISRKNLSEIIGISDSTIGMVSRRLIDALDLKVKEIIREDPKLIREARLTKFVSDLTSSLGVDNKVKEEAENLFHKMAENDMIHGNSTYAAICVSVYASCRLNGSFQTIKEIYENAQAIERSSFSYKMLTGYYRKTIQELGLKIPLPDKDANLVYLAEKCGLSEEAKNEALKELVRIKSSVEGLSPVVVSGALIYRAAVRTGETLKQEEIASKLGITSASIRNALKSRIK